MLRSLLQFVGIVYLTICCCSGGSTSSLDTKSITVYCVILTRGSDNACQGYNFTEKNTLCHYMMNSKYFKSYETYIFESGSHIPYNYSDVVINNATNLTLTGMNQVQSSGKAIIDCNGAPTTFNFTDSSNIVITDLIFKSCIKVSLHINQPVENGLATIFFNNGANFSMLRVSVLNCADEAFFIQRAVGSIIIDSVEVVNCSADKDLEYLSSGNAIVYNHFCNSAKSDIIIRNSRFIHNENNFRKVHLSPASGLKIILNCPNVKIKLDNVTMSGNIGGNLAIIIFPTESNFYSSVEISSSIFEGGTALKGAGMTVIVNEIDSRNISCTKDNIFCQKKILQVYNTTFVNNSVTEYGSGLFIKYKEALLECNTMILVTFENINFIDNSVNCNGNVCGGGIAFHFYTMIITNYLHHGNPQIQVVLSNCSFQKNHVEPFDSGTGVIFVKSSHFFQLNNSSIIHNKATGIIGMSSNIILSQNITILNNTGYNGGGIFLCQNAVIYLKAHTNVTIAYNNAKRTGGGICIETNFLASRPICFFQLGKDSLIHQPLIDTISVNLHDNLAKYAGDNIFGGSIYHCYMIQLNKTQGFNSFNEVIFKKLFNVRNNTFKHSSISSPPHTICLCQNKKPSCKPSSPFQLQLFPGETFSIDVVLVGQLNGTVPGTVQASLKSRHSSLKQGEYVQSISSTDCSQLKYTIYIGNDSEELQLKVQHTGDISGFEASFSSMYIIEVKIKDCPFAFSHTNNIKNLSCDCSTLLKSHSEYAYCDITNKTIKRSPPAWIGMIQKENGLHSVAFHTFCPFDYCLNSKVDLFATNNSLQQDAQCAFNRTGVLCGSCSEGLSVVLGKTNCHSCSNYWLLLAIPFAMLGIGLLIVMIVFDITIADGTLSGIIFYFNIIGSNLPVFFPEQSEKFYTVLTSVLKLVISLINLESGISMCLFDGMDSYNKTWLEFSFPIYLWILTGCFIILARARCSWIVRRNAVKVLATFILLSYTRLLTSIAGALQVSEIQLESQEYELRWLADGNVKYFQGKHISLAIFSIMLGFLLFPFALCLLFIQCLQKVSEKRPFLWVNRFKPIFDVYTAPFTSSGRFWTGLLLLSRCVLLLITAVNVNGNPNTVLGAISITVVLLLLIAGLLPAGLYRRRCLNVLEYSSLVNLGILSSLIIIFKNYHLISHVFVSVEIFIFIGVVVNHFTKLKVMQKYFCCRKVKIVQKLTRLSHKTNLPDGVEYRNDQVCNNNTARFVYYFAEDREPLLATAD